MYHRTVQRALLAMLFGAALLVGIIPSLNAASSAGQSGQQTQHIADGGGPTWPPPKI
jgi:hypothetical protein